MQLLLQPYVDQRLIWHIARVGGCLDRIQQMLWQTQRNGFGGGLQIGQHGTLCLLPVKVGSRVVFFPEGFFRLLVGEFRNCLWLAHKWLVPFGACPAANVTGCAGSGLFLYPKSRSILAATSARTVLLMWVARNLAFSVRRRVMWCLASSRVNSRSFSLPATYLEMARS